MRRLYEKRDCGIYKLNNRRGWPDFLVIDYPNYDVFLVEAKGRTDALKHHQAVVHERLQRSGLRVVTEWEPDTLIQDRRPRRK